MLRLDWNLLFTMIDLVIFYFLLKKFLLSLSMQLCRKDRTN